MEGYRHPLYAQSFRYIGEPLFLPSSKGWLIKRPIPGTNLFDAMGPYPLFFCENWHGLIDDFENLKKQLVSISFVIDPFGNPHSNELELYLDTYFAYKKHYLLDLSLSLEETISKNKQSNASRALKDVNVDLCISPDIDLDEWMYLYNCLINRHNIQDIRAFSQDCFAKQIAIPNTHFFRVFYQNNLVGGNLFYLQGEVAYSHLCAFSEKGYELGASYAVKWVAINHLKNVAKWLNIGGGTGKDENGLSGLDLFKSGWSSTTDKSYFCGKILNLEAYHTISAAYNQQQSSWFPAYREGEYN